MKQALGHFFGVPTFLAEPIGHSSDDSDPWPLGDETAPLVDYFGADWSARIDALALKHGFRTVASVGP